EERESARQMLVEARLWSGNSEGALEEAVRLAKSDKYAAAGRVLAALAILGSPEPDVVKARTLLANIKPDENTKAEWKGWYDAASFLLKLADEPATADSARSLTSQLSAIPA